MKRYKRTRVTSDGHKRNLIMRSLPWEVINERRTRYWCTCRRGKFFILRSTPVDTRAMIKCRREKSRNIDHKVKTQKNKSEISATRRVSLVFVLLPVVFQSLGQSVSTTTTPAFCDVLTLFLRSHGSSTILVGRMDGWLIEQ